jgi:uncharacterized protein
MKNAAPYTGLRNQEIDFIRGIALLGILLINIQTYSLFAFLRPGQVYDMQLDTPETYAPAQFFIHLFVKGQFYAIYCFLFGLSFWLMYRKSQQQELNSGRIFRGRLWILLLIGLIHAFVFWLGDVLHKYAILGFTLPFFYQKTVRTILKWIAGMVFLVIFIQIIGVMFFAQSPQQAAESRQAVDAVIMNVISVWKNGSPGEVMSLQWLGVAMLYQRVFQSGLSTFAHYEIMFLLGIVAGKLNVMQQLHTYRLQLIRLGFLLFPAAILLKAISCLPDLGFSPGFGHFAHYESLICSLAYFVSVPIISLVYLIEMALLLRNKSSRFITAIAVAGSMSLTNYLMQTAICMLLFYGYAGGLAGKLTLLESLALAVAIYLFQIVFSLVWFKYYDAGPLEAILKHRILQGKKSTAKVTQDVIAH